MKVDTNRNARVCFYVLIWNGNAFCRPKLHDLAILWQKVLVCAFTIIVAKIKSEYLKTFTIKTFNTALEFSKRLRAVYIDAEILLNKSDTWNENCESI